MGSCCQKSCSVKSSIVGKSELDKKKLGSPITSDNFDANFNSLIYSQRLDEFVVKGDFSKTTEMSFEMKGLRSENPDIEQILKKNRISVSCRKGSKAGKNQDNFFIASTGLFTILGVADGHGNDGEKIALLTCDLLQETLLSTLKTTECLEKTIEDSFIQVHNLIQEKSSELNIDCVASGCTMTLAIICSGVLFIANLGDSRAIIGKKVNKKILGISITLDHKAENLEEAERIERNGGIIRKLMKGDSQRVISPTNKNRGIITTRSFGDLDYKPIGVTYLPTISSFSLKEDHKFLLICSDGVWEYMSNDKVAKIVYENIDDPKRACKVLTDAARESWNIRQDNYVDDITAVLVILN